MLMNPANRTRLQGSSYLSCVYGIFNIQNGKCYIGSTKDVSKRWSEHLASLEAQRHGSSHLQYSWNLYGAVAFRFMTIEECPEDKLIEREQYWIEYFESYNGDLGYNSRRNAATSAGHKLSDETKHKMSLARKGRKNSDIARQRISAAKMGHTITEEQLNKFKETVRRKRENGWRPSFVPKNPPRPPELVRQIRSFLSNGLSQRKVEKMTGVSHSVICHISRRDKPYDYE